MRLTDETIIDLDAAFDPPAEPHRLRRKVIWRIRLAGIGALVLTCVATLGGAARPAPQSVTQLGIITWSRESREPVPPVIADGLLIADVDGEIYAYHPDGRLAWHTRPAFEDLAGGALSTSLHRWEDSVLLVGVTRTGNDWQERAEDLVSIALDPATGQQRWRVRGQVQRAGEVFLVNTKPFEPESPIGVYSSLPDGLIWTVPPAPTMLTDPASDALMTLSDQGIFTEYELSTGKPRRTAELRLPPPSPTEVRLTMELFRDRLIIGSYTNPGVEHPTVSISYDRATLRPLPASPLDQFVDLDECGPVVCARRNFVDLTILDSVSLTELWHTDNGMPFWTPVGLLMLSDSIRLLDERTGEDRLDIRRWNVLFDWAGLSTNSEVGRVLMTRWTGDRTYIARLTPRQVQVVAVVRRRLFNCAEDEGLLACSMEDGRTGVWRLDPP